MSSHDVFVSGCELYFSPIETRVPLKFGPEVTTHVVEARTCLTVESAHAHAEGWGETPLSIAWVWPSSLSYAYRQERLQAFCITLRDLWRNNRDGGHPMEIGFRFIEGPLKDAWKQSNAGQPAEARMPWLAALVCNSLFDLALHDAYGNLHGISTWESFDGTYMNHDLSWYFTDEYRNQFVGKYPSDYLVPKASVPNKLVAWHLVGAKDAIDEHDYEGQIVHDGYPFFLRDWIRRDGLKCLKIKLTGIDAVWDYRRIIAVGKIALEEDVDWLTADFNCTVTDPAYVTDILDRLVREHPRLYGMMLYVEQPFPYEIAEHPIDVHAVSARKPLFMDESAHDWYHVSIGRKLGWSGVALKTCKTLTGALLSLCWAKAHGMTLMVQDLTNPMLAQIPHVSLAAHAGTIMGVETNAMQFYPKVSVHEQRIHPGLYSRVGGTVDLTSIGKAGLGYRYDEIQAARIAAGGDDVWENT